MDQPSTNEWRGEPVAPRAPTLLEFNREIIVGECGSLLAAYGAAFVAAHFTANAAIISGSVVAGTLVGGTIFWLAARIAHQHAGKRWSARVLAADIGYFTPAAMTLGFVVYDPVIFFVSHGLLLHGVRVSWAVISAQACAFSLFLGSMNLYRTLLAKVRGRPL